MVFKCLVCIVQEKNKYKVFVCFLKTLINSKNCPESAPYFCFSFPSLSLVDFLRCTFTGRISEQFSGSHAAFGITFRVTGGYLKARKSSRGLLEGFSNLSVDCQSDFLHRKTVQNVKTIRAHSKI
jgi:hypothetical protein